MEGVSRFLIGRERLSELSRQPKIISARPGAGSRTALIAPPPWLGSGFWSNSSLLRSRVPRKNWGSTSTPPADLRKRRAAGGRDGGRRGRRAEMAEDGAHRRGVDDEGDDPHFAATTSATEWEDFVDAGERQEGADSLWKSGS